MRARYYARRLHCPDTIPLDNALKRSIVLADKALPTAGASVCIHDARHAVQRVAAIRIDGKWQIVPEMIPA